MKELLLRMLPAALRRNIHDAAFKKFKHGLLHSLTRNITGNGRIVALARDLVDLVDEDNTPFSLGNIIVGFLEKTRKNTLHILTHISGLRQDCRVHNRERHIEQLGYSLGHQCLSCTGRTYHEDV